MPCQHFYQTRWRERFCLISNKNMRKTTDKFSKRKRSEIMSKIRSSNTQFEKNFISELKKRTGKKFRINAGDLRGRPDIVFQKEKVCVFLDSDFWHGWQYPRWKKILKNDFWKQKIENNRARDKRTTSYLRKNGWRVIRIWGHDTKKDLIQVIEAVINEVNLKF